uniref:Uncharacterized protein n=1 Tax=Ditylenchus dipsaci TaxID=166011 RepID=A0A915DMU5_9BILA
MMCYSSVPSPPSFFSVLQFFYRSIVDGKRSRGNSAKIGHSIMKLAKSKLDGRRGRCQPRLWYHPRIPGFLLKRCRRELKGLDEVEKRSLKGKMEASTHKQTMEQLRPLIRSSVKFTCSPENPNPFRSQMMSTYRCERLRRRFSLLDTSTRQSHTSTRQSHTYTRQSHTSTRQSHTSSRRVTLHSPEPSVCFQ